MEDKEFQACLIKRLNTIISLKLDIPLQGKSISITRKIHRLHDLGLTPAEIGSILGKPTNYITAVIHGQSKKVKKKTGVKKRS